MSHLNEPMFPADERPEDRPIVCTIVPPYTEHDPCGMPGCGVSSTGKWASPVFRVEVRGIARNWAGLDNAVTDLVICNRCIARLGDLATEAFMAEEEKAVNSLFSEDKG
jgi:hypothetical protein